MALMNVAAREPRSAARRGRTAVDLDRARTMLTTEMEQLDERLRDVERSHEDVTSGNAFEEGALDQHPAEWATEVNSTMESELAVDTVAQQRRMVLEAIERLDAGTYGRCAVCGREIDDERLEARPEVDTCREHADVPVIH